MAEDCEEQFKFSALSKLKKVNHLINEVTIGPNSLKNVNLNHNTPKRLPKEGVDIREESSRSDSENQIPTRQFLQLLEFERQERVKNALSERLNIFEQFNRAQEEQGKQTWLKTQQSFIEDMERQEMDIIQVSKQYDLQSCTQHAKMAQQTQNAVLRMKQKQEQLKEKERQRQILSENVNKIRSNQQKFSLEYQEILSIFKSCTNNEELKTSTMIDFSLLKTLPAEMDNILGKCKGDNVSDISEKDVNKCNEIIAQIVNFKNKFKEIVEKINRKKLEVEKIKEASSKQIESNPNQTNAQLPKLEQVSITTENPIQYPKEKADNNIILAMNISKISKYVSISDLQVYTNHMEFLEKYRRSFKPLEDDSSMKTFRFDCKKAINIPVNSLSGVNSEHIMDKYKKLYRLLAGESVTVADKEVNASKHPQGIAFCTDLLAKKFVLQGDLMVSSNPESAFCYATVILSLWNDFPDFGRILLAYFYKFCPYLVPYYIPRQVGDTDEEFYMKLGYQYSDGEVERQDKFLKRMTGILKLYFAILITKPKRGQTSSPHDLKHGWKWLASFLRLEPQIDISATTLHVFLEMVGFEMEAKYGQMFQKVLTIIIQVFLPKCKEVKCTGGAVTRLELLLTEYLKNRKFEKPNGYVEYAYW